jgi:hypothetical protein
MGKEEEVKTIAYDLWKKSGMVAGNDQKNWFEAEKIWSKQHNGQSKKPEIGDYYHCDVCGVRVIIEDECSCSDPCDISCCGAPMKPSD